MMYSNVLASKTTPGTYNTDTAYFSAFTPEREDSTIRLTIALQASSASTAIEVYNASTQIQLNGGTAIGALDLYQEDFWLPHGGTWNVRSKADGVLLNFIRVLELFPPAG